MCPSGPAPPAQAADFRATAPLELDRAGVCCTSGHFLWSCFLPWGVFLPSFFRLWVLLCVAIGKLGSHHPQRQRYHMEEGCALEPSRSLLLRFSVSCIVVAILGYGMMSTYWCCWLSFESGCCSVSWPWGEVARDRARPYGPPYGTRIPCLPKTISPTNRGVP